MDVFAWGPHLILVASAVLAAVGATRMFRFRRFLEDVEAGKVRGLAATHLIGDAPSEKRALTVGAPDLELLQSEGDGAFRTAQIRLGGISRSSARRRSWALVLLVLATLSVLSASLAYSPARVPPQRSHRWM